MESYGECDGVTFRVTWKRDGEELVETGIYSDENLLNILPQDIVDSIIEDAAAAMEDAKVDAAIDRERERGLTEMWDGIMTTIDEVLHEGGIDKASGNRTT